MWCASCSSCMRELREFPSVRNKQLIMQRFGCDLEPGTYLLLQTVQLSKVQHQYQWSNMRFRSDVRYECLTKRYQYRLDKRTRENSLSSVHLRYVFALGGTGTSAGKQAALSDGMKPAIETDKPVCSDHIGRRPSRLVLPPHRAS